MGSAAPVTAASSVLERLPVSGWHWRLVVLVGIGTFFDLYEVFLGGVLAPVLAKEFGLGTLGKSMVIAAGFAGMFIGANVLSIAADRLGRRRVFILNLLVYSVFSFAAAFSPNIETFLVLRVIAGIGLGAELVLVDTYLAEFMPAKSRGRMTAWAYTIGFLGVPLAALLGGKLVARQEFLGIDGWRWLLLFGGLGAVFIMAVRTMLPESPRWLESRGRHAEARAVVESVTAKVAPGTPVTETVPETASASGDEARSVAPGAGDRVPRLPQAHRDAGDLPGSADGGLLRVRHPRAARLGEQGLRGDGVAGVRGTGVRRLPPWFAHFRSAGGTVRAQAPDHRLSPGNRTCAASCSPHRRTSR